ncbi:hypothetical protein COCOBI_01-8150 [Coccomyxa sp. Obi]|nr:hypothetical protein COCOBI_01-8150 [Coccomyxa sp. Obi]
MEGISGLKINVGHRSPDALYGQSLRCASIVTLETPEPEAATRSEASTVQHAEYLEAKLEEAKGKFDVTCFALFLTMVSGETIKHPWVSQLDEVGSGDMDPRELLKVYVEEPQSLTLRSLKNPRRSWTPSLQCSPGVEKSVSKIAALRALVGSKKWKTSPKLQKALEGIHRVDLGEVSREAR